MAQGEASWISAPLGGEETTIRSMSLLLSGARFVLLALGWGLLGLMCSGWRASEQYKPASADLATAVHTFPLRDSQELAMASRWVQAGTEHSIARRIQPQENWLQWLVGCTYPPFQRTQDTARLLKGSATDCSERCQILKTWVERSGWECRFVGLNGHVVLEILADGSWRVADPDYGLFYEQGVAYLQSPAGKSVLQKAIANTQVTPHTADEYVAIFQSASDNRWLPVGSPLSPRLALLEELCGWLAWLLPAVAIAAGLLLKTRSRGAAVRPTGERTWGRLRPWSVAPG